jgi:hypothetical protein
VWLAWRRRRTGPDHAHDAAVRRLEGVAEQLEEQLVRSRRRFWPGIVALGLGAVIFLGSISWGSDRLDVSPPPTDFPHEIAFRGPGWPVTHRGIVLGTNIQVSGCHAPVEVTIVAAATAEYWRRNARDIARRPRFELEVDDLNLASVTAGVADLRDTLDPSGVSLAPFDKRSSRGVTGLRVRKRDDLQLTAITGRVENWHKTWSPIYVHFFAEWLAPRGRGSCFVRLPALVGTGSIALLDALLDPGGILQAFNNLTVYGGSLDPSSSLPAPTTFASPTSAWHCVNSVPPTRDASPEAQRRGEVAPGIVPTPSGSGVAFTEDAFRSSRVRTQTCGGVAVVEETGSDVARDLDLLIVGALIGLGLALLVQGLLTTGQAASEARPARGRREPENPGAE